MSHMRLKVKAQPSVTTYDVCVTYFLHLAVSYHYDALSTPLLNVRLTLESSHMEIQAAATLLFHFVVASL